VRERLVGLKWLLGAAAHANRFCLRKREQNFRAGETARWINAAISQMNKCWRKSEVHYLCHVFK
jgi:hypothetical protein